MIPFSIDGIDVALQSVVAIVKIRYHQIELFNHGFANYADAIGVAHKDKIIAARIAAEPLYSGKLTVDCRKNGLLKRILAYVSKSILQLDLQLSQRFASGRASLALNEDGRKVQLLEPCDHHIIKDSPPQQPQAFRLSW